MAENWDAIAAEIQVAIASVGFEATLIRRTLVPGLDWKPVTHTEAEYPVIVIDDQIKTRNADGSLTGRVQRVLTLSALDGVTPNKDDRLLVRGTRHIIEDVLSTAPGGTDLLFDVVLGGPDGAP